MIGLTHVTDALIDVERVTDALPVVQPIPADDLDFVFPMEFCSGRWLIMCAYRTGTFVEENGEVFEAGAFRPHYGRRTGNLVTFSRLSDAERFCRVLAGVEAPAC